MISAQTRNCLPSTLKSVVLPSSETRSTHSAAEHSSHWCVLVCVAVYILLTLVVLNSHTLVLTFTKEVSSCCPSVPSIAHRLRIMCMALP